MPSTSHASAAAPVTPAESGVAVADLLTHVDDLQSQVEHLARSPLMQVLADPARVSLVFEHDGVKLAVVARSPQALAAVTRALRIARPRRRGRPGQRTWEFVLRPAAEQPRHRFPRKAVR